jgi:hypothetical protein
MHDGSGHRKFINKMHRNAIFFWETPFLPNLNIQVITSSVGNTEFLAKFPKPIPPTRQEKSFLGVRTEGVS